MSSKNTRLVFIQNLYLGNLNLMYDTVYFHNQDQRFSVINDVLGQQLQEVYSQ